MIIQALLVAASLATPVTETAPTGDTFEIFLANQSSLANSADGVRIEADRLELVQGNLVVLRSESFAVAVFQSHQVQLVVNRSARGVRTFDVISQMGGSVEVHADRMVPQQNNVILFYTGDRIVGLASQNGIQMVIDRDARLESDEGASRLGMALRERNRG